MSRSAQQRRGTTRRNTAGVISCPACGGPLKADSKWCPACQFTGGRTEELFPHDPPPLLPVLDAVGMLSVEGERKIASAVERLRRRFPQFHWKVCIVNPPDGTSLPVFGFWLLNVCPLHGTETMEERAWTVLLLINAASGQAAVVPGYGADPFLADEEWKTVLAHMTEPWRSGKPVEAILRFLNASRASLDHAWKRYGARRSGR